MDLVCHRVQCGFAYAVSLILYQLGMLFSGSGSAVGAGFAVALLALMVYLLVRPYREPAKQAKAVSLT